MSAPGRLTAEQMAYVDDILTRLSEARRIVREIDEWEGYDTHDIGHAFLAETVYDLRDDLRRALDGTP